MALWASPQTCAAPFRGLAMTLSTNVFCVLVGYFHQQSTKPQTLAYGLNDSPVGTTEALTFPHVLS